jgi:hypothetical protein
MSSARDTISNFLPVIELLPSQVTMLDSIAGDDASALVRYLFRECKNSPEARFVLPALFKVVESSDRSLAQWVRELVEVFSWLEVRNSSARFKDVLEYVSCAYEGSSSEVGHSIAWYLEQYGFEKSLER